MCYPSARSFLPLYLMSKITAAILPNPAPLAVKARHRAGHEQQQQELHCPRHRHGYLSLYIIMLPRKITGLNVHTVSFNTKSF